MERAIRQLYDGLEESRGLASQAAEDAANRAAERVMAAQLVQQTGPSPELQALEDGLRAVRDSAASGTLPPWALGTRSWPSMAGSDSEASASCTRIGTWRSGRLSLDRYCS